MLAGATSKPLTAQPCASKVSAMAKPMPELLPVTIALCVEMEILFKPDIAIANDFL
jgi:hypothetical protein